MLSGRASILPQQTLDHYRLSLLPGQPGEVPDLLLPENVVVFLRRRIAPVHRLSEHLGAVFVDHAARPLAYSVPYLGYLGRLRPDHRLLLAPGLLLGAIGLILFHHRPNGDAKPDRPSLRLARRVRDAGEVMGLRLLDVLLVGENDAWISLQRDGRLKLYALGEHITPPDDDGRSQVKPKYRNPRQPEQTWSGRGRMTLWLREQIAGGARLEDFRIEE